MSSPSPVVTCSVCGRVAPVADPERPESGPLDWMSESDPRRGTVWVCPSCVREHIRSVEARLDQTWW